MVESSEVDMAGHNKLRPDLMVMLKKTASQLTRNQMREAYILLNDYTYLFAKSKSDEGRTCGYVKASQWT